MKRFQRFLPIFVAAIAALHFVAPVAVHATDLSVTATSVIASDDAKIASGYAGTTLAAGKVVYRDPTDQRFYLANASGSTPLYKAIGITLNGASAGQPIRVVTSDPNFTPGGTVANGAIYVVSGANAGGIAPVADLASGWKTSVLFVGVGSNKVNLRLLRADVAVP